MRRNIIPYDPWLKELARPLRNNSTQSEIKLWLNLKGEQMRGYELKLVIEIDGYTHQLEEVAVRDVKKEKALASVGLTVLRFEDAEVHYDINNVLRTIEMYIDEFEEIHTPGPSQERNKM